MTIQLQIPMTVTIPNDKLIQQVDDCISDIVSDAICYTPFANTSYDDIIIEEIEGEN